MRKHFDALLMAVFVVVSAIPGQLLRPAKADANPFVQMLNVVPDSAANSLMIGYADFRAIVAARPGAAPLNSRNDFNAIQSSKDASGALAMAAFNGITIADPNLADYFFQIGDGIDPFSIQREMDYGDPPAHLLLLNGNFDSNAISSALSTHGFIQSDLSDPAHNVTVLCGTQACDKGKELDMSAVDPANPFGGNLGRKEPIALVPGYMFGSADYSVFQNQLNAVQGKGALLANVPDFAALAEAIIAQGNLIQIEMLDPKVADTPLDSSKVSPAIRAALTKALSQFGPIPAYSRVAIAHLVKDDNQLAVVALVYDQATDAQTAAQIIPERLTHYVSLVSRQSFTQLLTTRNATLDTPQVYAAANGKSVLLLTFRAPIESSTPDANGQYQRSGLLFRLFVNMVDARDMYWLITSVPTS